MPYNTRRKSLSLPSLGIQLPRENQPRAHRPVTKTPAADGVTQPPSKKIKTSHDEHEPPSPVSSPRSKAGSPIANLPSPKVQGRRLQHTPPPSPGDVVAVRKIDTEGINDDIVIAVIEQLEKTGNRPHLIKELATVLTSTNESIANSANSPALLSSRLSLYLKRPWTALSPCPIAKELIPVHPRKVFFYLTSQPRRPLPENSNDILPPSFAQLKRLTPSLSDPSVDEEDVELEARERARMSPSPEIDLFSPELEHGSPAAPSTPGEPFSGRSSVDPVSTPPVRHRPNRAPSPPLEADERGFTETATAVRARGMSLKNQVLQPVVDADPSKPAAVDETPEQRQKRDQELGYALFGQSHGLQVPEQKVLNSSPMIQPKPNAPMSMLKLDIGFAQQEDIDMVDAWGLKSPETVGVDELDAIFTGF